MRWNTSVAGTIKSRSTFWSVYPSSPSEYPSHSFSTPGPPTHPPLLTPALSQVSWFFHERWKSSHLQIYWTFGRSGKKIGNTRSFFGWKRTLTLFTYAILCLQICSSVWFWLFDHIAFGIRNQTETQNNFCKKIKHSRSIFFSEIVFCRNNRLRNGQSVKETTNIIS